MIAAIPRMVDYVGIGMTIAVVLGIVAAFVAGSTVESLDDTDNTDVLGAAVLAFLAVLALVIVGDCLLYAAAWTDYRRGAR